MGRRTTYATLRMIYRVQKSCLEVQHQFVWPQTLFFANMCLFDKLATKIETPLDFVGNVQMHFEGKSDIFKKKKYNKKQRTRELYH